MGNLFLYISLLTSIFAIYNYYLSREGDLKYLLRARNSYYTATFAIIAASVLLMYLILSHQYQYKYIFEFSGNNLSTGLLMSSFYAGQEGSFLLWLLFMMLIGLVMIKVLKRKENIESTFMIFFILVAVFLNILLLPGLKNPFEEIWTQTNYLSVSYFNNSILKLSNFQHFIFSNSESQGSFVKVGPELLNALKLNGISVSQFIIDGKGLNPLLQNFWMQIHPPLLFFGFALCTLPYASAMSSLMRNEYKSFVNIALPSLAIGMTFLGLAIMIGGYWAYGVLGWGGYWGWDPVENSSLVPWIIGMALIHTLIIQKHTMDLKGIGKFPKTNLVLAIFTLVATVYSTFLTRSGILSNASVHSFTEPGRATYIVLVVFIISLLLIGLYYLKKRWSAINIKSTYSKIQINRENGLFFGSMLLIGTSLIIITGTSAPIFNLSVKSSFYNTMNLPLVILIILLIPLSLLINWNEINIKSLIKLAIPSISVSAILTFVICYGLKITNPLYIIFILGCIFTFVISISKISEYIRYEPKLIGGPIAHIGFSIFLLGVLLNALITTSADVNLEIYKPSKIGDYTYRYVGYHQVEGTNKFQFHVKIQDSDSEFDAFPVMYNSSYNEQIMKEPYIINGFYQDHYISPISYSENRIPNDSNSKEIRLKKGEEWTDNNITLKFKKFVYSSDDMTNMIKNKDFSFGALINLRSKSYNDDFTLYMKSINGKNSYTSKFISELKSKVELTKIDASGVVFVRIINLGSNANTFKNAGVLTINAKLEPFINLVWIGVVLMAAGLLIAWNYRRKSINTK